MSERKVRFKAAEIFLEAASYIRKYGWQVCGMSEHGKPRCSMGALESAGSEKRWNKNVAALMYDTLYEELKGLSLTQFNYKYQNGEKVAQLFERSAQSIKH
jgi:hypothetical protein